MPPLLDSADSAPVLQPSEAGNGFTLRIASLQDTSALARAAATFFVQTFGSANRREDMDAYLASAFSVERQRADLQDPNQRVWLALGVNGDTVGYAHVRRRPLPTYISIARPSATEIARIYADQTWHGHGLGAALLRACIATAQEWRAEVIWLGVWERNPRAIAFYEKHGFRAVGEQEFQLGADRQRDVVMALYLTTAS